MGQLLQRVVFLIVLTITGGQMAVAVTPSAQLERETSAIAQNAEIVEITEIELVRTEEGIEILLVTESGRLPVPVTETAGNTLIIEIPNAGLNLAGETSFESLDPIVGISAIEAVTLPEQTVRLEIIGTETAPMAETRSDEQGLQFKISATEEEAIELIVTAEAQDNYFIPNASTATRTETPLRDIPQSIQVIPEEVIEDQRAIRLNEVLRNVSGVTAGNTRANDTETFTVRGFPDATILRDGIRQFTFGGLQETANLEQVEVLKGPASVVYGATEPGGVINVVTEKPLSEPFYEVEGIVGSYGFLEPRIDLSGPLNTEGTLLYRLNTLYREWDDFRNFDQDHERFFVAPVLAWSISDQTDLTLELEVLENTQPYDRGVVAVGEEVADIPFDRIFHEPDDFVEIDELRTGYRLEHEFNENWKFRNLFRYSNIDLFLRAAELDSVDEDLGVVNRSTRQFDIDEEAYDFQGNLVGEFNTGTVEHQLLLGFDFRRSSQDLDLKQAFAPPLAPPPISLFNPVYGFSLPNSEEIPVLFDGQSQLEQWGFYLQDLVSFTDNFKLLLSGRYDIADQEAIIRPTDFFDASSPTQSDDAFSPRLGVVYQPTEQVSLYASFSRSFQPNDITFGGNLPEPERGTQYEIGAKTEFFDGRLSATLALYDLTKTNVSVADPNNPGFSIALGEQQNQGIELDIVGEILPGWNIIASYSHIDAEVTEGFSGIPAGGRPANVAENTASFWTTYEIGQGNLQGLGFGIGWFFVGERFGDFGNTFTLDDYVRTDATIFYRQDNWNAALNFKNLFDIDYIESSIGRVQINPGEPFTVMGSFSVEF
jgi:iron complex outermembrane receptor protein